MPDAVIPLSPAADMPTYRGGRGIDLLSIGLLLAFAFVSASYVARNSDVWLHLATGRLLVQGEYRFGVDPFTYTATTQYWVNHAWLFDIGLYWIFGQFGGAGVVALKAIAIVATAALMLYSARGRGPAWMATGCILLAVLAMSSRLLLQPMVVSLLLLAGCLCCLRIGGRALVAIPILIAVWVNVDSWFVLGPALVALFWVGQRLDPNRTTQPSWPIWLFPAVFCACLLNPHHIYAIQLPWELSPAVWRSGFRTDPRFAGLFASPWRWEPLGAAGGYNFAAWAFFVLFGLGLVSFAVNRRAVWGWRASVWLAFALLAAWQVRLIPFFAVVAGPITALNLGEVWPSGAYARSGRGLIFTTVITLLVLGWQGWTNGIHNHERGAAWAVHPDPTLVRAASGVVSWRQTNTAPPEARVFPTHPDVGHYLAWFAPGEKYLLDSRLKLFTGVADEFAVLSRAVGVLPHDGTEPSAETLNQFGIAAVLLYDPSGARLTRGLGDAAVGKWEILRIDGAAVLLLPPGGSYALVRFDAERQAFRVVSEQPVPGAGPALSMEQPPWWRPTRERGRMGSWEADAAMIYLRLGEAGGSKSPALPLLSIRAARAGIETDSHDSIAWLVLGRAYLFLGARTWEREAGAGLTLLEHIRFLQATGALVQSARENPDSIPAHESLARLFLRRNMIDLAYRHAVIASRLLQRVGRFEGESEETFGQRVAETQAMIDAIEGALQDAQNRYLVRTVGLAGDPLGQARIAGELGLTQKAIDILVASHPDLYGMVGLGLLADLLLQTGQVAECRILLDRNELRRNPNGLGFYNLPRKANPDGTRWTYRLYAYDWLDLCQHAAAGRYQDAAAAVDRLIARFDIEERRIVDALTMGSATLFASEVGLGVPPTPPIARLMAMKEQVAMTELLNHNKSLSITRADLATLMGVLELERGNLGAATVRFETALSLYRDAVFFTLSRPGEPLATRYYEVMQQRN